MLYDQITIDPVYDDPTVRVIVFIVAYAVASIIVLVLWLLRRSTKKHDLKPKYIKRYETAIFVTCITLGCVLAGTFIAASVLQEKNEHEVRDRQLTAMIEQLGYNPVTIKPADDGSLTMYTARDSDGQYVSGELVEIDTGVYLLKADEY